MAVDKEALICLSRVYSYYFKCNFPLFYVYPALTRYLSILFLNILTLLACTHSSDNLFHTLMVLCENENFLTSNLLCFFTRVKLCPLVILLSLILKKKVRIRWMRSENLQRMMRRFSSYDSPSEEGGRRRCHHYRDNYRSTGTVLHEADGLVLRGDRLVVPSDLRQDMLKLIHESHQGMDKCKARARTVLY